MKTNLPLRLVKNKASEALVFLFAFLLSIPLIVIVYYVLKNGLSAMSWTFLTHLPKPVGETGGGISNAIVGTFIVVGLASIISIPVGILTGIYLNEFSTTRMAKLVRLSVEVLQGIPSIVIGIVAYLWVVVPLGRFSAFSGGVALGMMMLPLITLSTEETIKLIPKTLKEASLALGVPYYRTILKVVLPTGLSGILTGILLSLSRVAGETAPLLFTAFGNPFMNVNITKPVQALPLLIFNYSTSPYEEWQKYGWGASLLLIAMIFCLSLIVKGVTNRR